MARSNRTRAEVEARRELVFRLWCRCVPWSDIARQAGVSEVQAWRDLQHRRAVVAKLEADSVERSRRCREQAIGTYRTCIREAFDEWDRSKADQQRRRSKAKKKGAKMEKPPTDGGPQPAAEKPGIETEAEEITQGRVGDASLLNVVVKAQARIDVLEDSEPPKRKEIAGEGGGPIVVKVLGGGASMDDL